MRQVTGARNEKIIAISIQQPHQWSLVLALRTALLGVHHHQTGQTGDLVGVPLYGDAFLKFGKAYRTGYFSHNRMGVRVPAGNDLTGFDGITVLDHQLRTVGNLITLPLATLIIH